MRELAKDDALLVLWVTNDPAVIGFAETSVLPAWGFQMVSTWWWLKLKPSGEPVCSTGGRHKSPYERVQIGCRSTRNAIKFDRPLPDFVSKYADGILPKEYVSILPSESSIYHYSSRQHSACSYERIPWRCIASIPLILDTHFNEFQEENSNPVVFCQRIIM